MAALETRELLLHRGQLLEAGERADDGREAALEVEGRHVRRHEAGPLACRRRLGVQLGATPREDRCGAVESRDLEAGLVLAILTGVIEKATARFFGRFKERVVVRALIAGVVFSVVGVFAPVMMFSGETQVQTLIKDAAGCGVALLLVMAVAKLALLSVGLKIGFLGGATFPLIFASTSAAFAINLLAPRVPVTILVAGVVTGALYPLFRTPQMVVVLASFMLAASATLIALIVLIVLSMATVMIVTLPLQRRMAARQGARGRPRGRRRRRQGRLSRTARPRGRPGGLPSAARASVDSGSGLPYACLSLPEGHACAVARLSVTDGTGEEERWVRSTSS